MEGMKPPLYRQGGSLFQWVGAFCIREEDRCCHSSGHRGYLPISLPLCSVWPCLPWPSSMSGHIHHGVHYLPASMGIDLRSAATSYYLRSSSILGGHSGRCPWQKLQLSIFPPRGTFTGRSSGDCLIIVLLWCPLSFTSCRGSLAWGGTGTPVPCMMAAHTQGNANFQCNKKKLVSVEDLWPSLLVCHFVRGYLLQSEAPPPKSLLPTYPWSSSFP